MSLASAPLGSEAPIPADWTPAPVMKEAGAERALPSEFDSILSALIRKPGPKKVLEGLIGPARSAHRGRLRGRRQPEAQTNGPPAAGKARRGAASVAFPPPVGPLPAASRAAGGRPAAASRAAIRPGGAHAPEGFPADPAREDRRLKAAEGREEARQLLQALLLQGFQQLLRAEPPQGGGAVGGSRREAVRAGSGPAAAAGRPATGRGSGEDAASGRAEEGRGDGWPGRADRLTVADLRRPEDARAAAVVKGRRAAGTAAVLTAAAGASRAKAAEEGAGPAEGRPADGRPAAGPFSPARPGGEPLEGVQRLEAGFRPDGYFRPEDGLGGARPEPAAAAFREWTRAEVLRSELLRSEVVRHTGIILRDGGEGEIRLVLKPESLGSVRIRIHIQPESIEARILVDNQEAKALLEGNLEDLRHALRNEGFQAASLSVSVGGEDRGGEEPGQAPQGAARQAAASELERAVPALSQWPGEDRLVNLIV